MEPLARWDRARSVWATLDDQLCGHSDVFSETWPSSGMTRAGLAYALPTWEPRTDGSGSSSSPGLPELLPTPNASDTSKHSGQPAHLRKARGHSTRIADVIEFGLPTSPGAPASGAT
jgi:hypothetical protein